MRMPLTPKDLSFLAASAPSAGSGGGLVTRKGYRPRIRSSRNGVAICEGSSSYAGRGAAGTSWTGSGRRGWLRRFVARVTAATKRTTPWAARTVPRRVGSRPAAPQRSRRKAYGTLFGRLALTPLADHHVIALCPTCHRRVHHAADGENYNGELRVKLDAIEPR